MALTHDLVKYGTSIGVALATGNLSAGLVPLVTLSQAGQDHWSKRDATILHKAQNDVLAALSKSREINEDDKRAAGDFLRSIQNVVKFDPLTMFVAEQADNVGATLINQLFGEQLSDHTPGVKAAIKLTLETAYRAVRDSSSYKSDMTLAGVRSIDHAVAELVRQVTHNNQLSAEAKHIAERQQELVLALARRYAEGTPADFDAALRGLERALEVATKEREYRSTSLNEVVERVVARVDALNDAGYIDDAMNELKSALVIQEKQEAQATAAIDTLLKRALEQAFLSRSVEDATSYTLRLHDRLPGSSDDSFHRLRLEQKRWLEHGDIEGLFFDLQVSISLAHELIYRAKDSEEYDAARCDLAIALHALGTREVESTRLEEAVKIHRDRLIEQPNSYKTVNSYETQSNLGSVLLELGQREEDTVRLEESIKAFSSALKNVTRKELPFAWAKLQGNLGNALALLGEYTSNVVRLMEAVEAFRAALEIQSPHLTPYDWARTQSNMGGALLHLGQRGSGTFRLRESIAACRAALKFRSRRQVPLQWALTQSNLGNALSCLGEREGSISKLEAGVTALHCALEERTRERGLYLWAITHLNIATAELKLALRLNAPDARLHLEAAKTACCLALEVFQSGASLKQSAWALKSLKETESAITSLDAGTWPLPIDEA